VENTKARGAKVRPFTEKEFLVAMGILIAAAGYDWRGCELWASDDPDIPVCEDVKSWRSIIQSPNFGKFMGENRFKEYRKLIPSIWEDKDAKESDPWWNFSQAVEEFNQQRRNKITASLWKVEDESMSAWCPRKTKTGGLPNISYVIRKPEPLGRTVLFVFVFLLLPYRSNFSFSSFSRYRVQKHRLLYPRLHFGTRNTTR